jgi:predicted nucleic acid-binding protein
VRLVLDADVLIGALDGTDQHHFETRELFASWWEQDARLLISVVNLTEVLVAPAADAEQLRLAREAITALGVEIHKPGAGIGVQAARLRGRHPISLADAYCLATAKQANGAVASFDRKVLRAAVNEGISSAIVV